MHKLEVYVDTETFNTLKKEYKKYLTEIDEDQSFETFLANTLECGMDYVTGIHDQIMEEIRNRLNRTDFDSVLLHGIFADMIRKYKGKQIK